MSTEIPIWVNENIRWVSGVDKRTTCKDVVEVLLVGEGIDKTEVKDFTIMERWRRVERPLDENSKILKVWSHWGDEKKEVRLCLRRIDNEVDSGRGSPVGVGNTPSLRRRRHHRSRNNGKPPWSHQETLHPRRLAELGGFKKEEYEEYQKKRLKQMESSDGRTNEDPIYDSRHCIYGKKHDTENSGCRKKSKSYHCSGTGMLHSTLISEDPYSKPKCCSKRQSKQKVRNSENIEKLMKLILAQGATIQNQLQKLKEREEQIQNMEHQRHRERVEKNGRNYLLETYLGSLNEAEVPDMIDEEKGNDSGVHTEGGSDQMNPRDKETVVRDTKCRRGRLKNEEEETEKVDRNRSKSETRVTNDKECDRSLKRTMSENVLVDSSDNAKEEAEDTVELRRIQSQVEMWGKVFKINKKLEKEEENLVRLHIKIRRYQTENIKFAKEDQTDDNLIDDCRTIQKNLEVLRSDLDQNSKEIYKNFTKLIEEDEEVDKKKAYLTRLMTDLDRTEHEHKMLNELVHTNHDMITSFCEEEDNIGLSLQVKGQEKKPILETPTNVKELIQRSKENDQRSQSDQKPKTVKITFQEDQVQNPDEKSKEPTTTTSSSSPGAIKGILKNRFEIHQFQKCSTYGSNINEGKEKYTNKDNVQSNLRYFPNHQDMGNVSPIYSYPVNSAYNNPIYGESLKPLPKIQEHTVHKIGNNFQNGTIVTTKAVIHNDTDSSTSSDTSGLSSMYSSSPTVEEPYVESGYVLDTLV